MKRSKIALALALFFSLAFSACSPIQEDPLAEENLNAPLQEPISATLSADELASYKAGGSVCDVYALPMINTASNSTQVYANAIFSHTLTDLTLDIKPANGLKLTSVQVWDGDFNASFPLLPDGTPDVSQFPHQFTYPTGSISHQQVFSKSNLAPCHGFAIHAAVAFIAPNNQILFQKDCWMLGHRQGQGMIIELCIPMCGAITSSLGI